MITSPVIIKRFMKIIIIQARTDADTGLKNGSNFHKNSAMEWRNDPKKSCSSRIDGRVALSSDTDLVPAMASLDDLPETIAACFWSKQMPSISSFAAATTNLKTIPLIIKSEQLW
mmetsp:Transcript_89895/g.140538  ORF Transcript_89895/g.140538 Transcript_89895/m.140538 type:complete len:115 (-) Transcript_89895:41-385(-)